ncbi:MAG: MFS transporter [Anaerolineales bacterium]|jgi:MFS family permease
MTRALRWAVFFLHGRLGYAKEEAAGPTSFLMMLVGIFILLFALPSGWLADRLGRKPLVALAGITAALGSLIVILAPNLRTIYIGGCFIGAATGVFYTANWALGTDLVPKA